MPSADIILGYFLGKSLVSVELVYNLLETILLENFLTNLDFFIVLKRIKGS